MARRKNRTDKFLTRFFNWSDFNHTSDKEQRLVMHVLHYVVYHDWADWVLIDERILTTKIDIYHVEALRRVRDNLVAAKIIRYKQSSRWYEGWYGLNMPDIREKVVKVAESTKPKFCVTLYVGNNPTPVEKAEDIGGWFVTCDGKTERVTPYEILNREYHEYKR